MYWIFKSCSSQNSKQLDETYKAVNSVKQKDYHLWKSKTFTKKGIFKLLLLLFTSHKAMPHLLILSFLFYNLYTEKNTVCKRYLTCQLLIYPKKML